MAGQLSLPDYEHVMREFNECFESLVCISMAASEVKNMLELGMGKQGIGEKKQQLELVIAMVDWLQKTQKKKAVKAKMCNFFNRGFCKEGLGCRFDHSESEICERFSVNGICIIKDICTIVNIFETLILV